MKIIFLTANYYPEIAANVHLAKDLVEDLASHGYNVSVITQKPKRFVNENNKGNFKYPKQEVLLDGKVIINRVNISSKNSKSLIYRVLKECLLTIKLFLCALLIREADIIFVYSTPPTLGLMGVFLGMIKKIPVIYNLQDIFPDSLINAGIIKEGFFLKIGRLIERYTYKNSTKILVISDDFKRIIMDREVPENKIDIIYNWVDTNVVKPISREKNSLFNKYNLDKKGFYITYCGNIGLTQNLELLVDVAKELDEYKDIHFVIIGNGAHKQKLVEYTIEKRIENIRFLPFQPYEDISNVYSLGDIGVIISKKNIGNNSFPSKTWSIMSAERAVLASFDEDSELCKIVNNCNCGICVSPEDKISLKDAILNFYNNREYTKQIGCDGRAFILKNLNRKDNTDKIYNIIKNTL